MNVLQHTRNERNPCLKQNRPDRSYRDTLLKVLRTLLNMTLSPTSNFGFFLLLFLLGTPNNFLLYNFFHTFPSLYIVTFLGATSVALYTDALYPLTYSGKKSKYLRVALAVKALNNLCLRVLLNISTKKLKSFC